MSVVTFTGYTPAPRFDGNPWTDARIEGAATSTGPWTAIETIALSPVDADPENPQVRNFTTEAATGLEAWFRVVFIDDDGDESLTDPVPAVPGQGDYPTAADLVAESSVQDLKDADPAEQEAYREAAIGAIEDFCGQRFVTTGPETRTYDGQGGRRFFLPDRLARLDAVAVQGTAMAVNLVTLAADGRELTVNPNLSPSWVVRAESDWDTPPSFLGGLGNVTVTGLFGWTTVPGPVRQALRIDMEDQALADNSELGPSIRALAALGVKQASEGPRSWTIRSAPNLSGQVRRLLKPFVWVGPGVRA